MIILLLLIGNVFAHEDDVIEKEMEKSALNLTDPVNYIAFSFVWLIIFTAYLIIKRKKFVIANEISNKSNGAKGKRIIFLLMIAPVVLSTLYLAGYTIYENLAIINGKKHSRKT